MEHVVFFSESSGDPAFRRPGDLDEALRLVESLRNDRGITDVSLHELIAVPVSFRTYYHVEVGAADDGVSDDGVSDDGVFLAPAVDMSDRNYDGPLDLPPLDVVVVEPDLVVADDMPPLMLLPDPPVEPVELVERPHEDQAEAEMDAEPPMEPLDDLSSYEQPVPMVRSAPEAERSLGYFAH